MRKLSAFIILFVGVALSVPAKSSQGWRIGYFRYVYNPAPLKQNYIANMDMTLDIFGDIVTFYSEKGYLRDSLYSIAFDGGNIVNEEAYELCSKFKGGARDVIRIDKSQQLVFQYYFDFLCIFEGKSPLEIPMWTITDETREIRSRQCKKAEVNYYGRHWEAWYTEDIPLNFGPWLLWGLPGLVVEAHDSKKEICFELNYIEQLNDNHRSEFLLDYYKTNTFATQRFSGNLKESERLHTKFMTDRQFHNKITGVIREWAVDASGKTFDPWDNYRYIPIIPDSYWDEK